MKAARKSNEDVWTWELPTVKEPAEGKTWGWACGGGGSANVEPVAKWLMMEDDFNFLASLPACLSLSSTNDSSMNLKWLVSLSKLQLSNLTYLFHSSPLKSLPHNSIFSLNHLSTFDQKSSPPTRPFVVVLLRFLGGSFSSLWMFAEFSSSEPSSSSSSTPRITLFSHVTCCCKHFR